MSEDFRPSHCDKCLNAIDYYRSMPKISIIDNVASILNKWKLISAKNVKVGNPRADTDDMNTKRIEIDKTYMAVSNRKELKIKVDLVLLDIVHGTNIETGRGIALPSSYFVAGPLKEIIGPRLQD